MSDSHTEDTHHTVRTMGVITATNGGGYKKSIQEIIATKRDGGILSESDITTWVEELVRGAVAGCQLGAWLMAVYVRGLNLQETTFLTKAMMASGLTLSWPNKWKPFLVDKHSTGGVGDKVSLPLAPALAACGLKVPMISGRGLGITGGTLDKLESIPGYRVQLTLDEITSMMESVGCCIVGQTGEICPADKLMYAARDITATVGSLGLITSSIISKKAAEGISCLVLDIKWGGGCYQATLEEAEATANALLRTSRSLGVKTTGVISHMESPLGKAVGNSLEVEEALGCLRGAGPADLRELVVTEGAMLLVSAGTVSTLAEGQVMMEDVLDSGAARERFRRMLIGQGVEVSIADRLCGEENSGDVLPRAQTTTQLVSPGTGWVRGADARAVGLLSQGLGAGRELPDDELDLSAGVELLVSPGDRVEEGQVWAVVHHSSSVPPHLLDSVSRALDLANTEEAPRPRITRILGEQTKGGGEV